MYLFCTSGWIHTRVTISSGDAFLFVFTFGDSRFGPNISSVSMMSYLVTDRSGSLLPLVILM